MMTLFKGIRDTYGVKTHHTKVQLTLVRIRMEQVTKTERCEMATGVTIKHSQLGRMP